MPQYTHQDLFELSEDPTPYRLLTTDFVREEKIPFNTSHNKEEEGRGGILIVEREGLVRLAREALRDVNFYFRPGHLAKLRAILEDPEASDNDRFVAMTELRNAVVAAQGQLPSCQDTGTATVIAKKGQAVWTGFDDESAIAEGISQAYLNENLRYSQMAPISMFEEKNTGNNLPAQIDIYAEPGEAYKFLFLAKGGGSANKTFLFQETKARLNEKALAAFLNEKLFSLGTSACPPYHLAIVIGGTSAEANLKTVKLASAGYLDGLPTTGNAAGRAFRDPEWEGRVQRMAWDSRIGAQFGGKYFVHDVRVIRLPRHAASCPIGIGVSCSADRNIKAKITREGIFLEQLETRPDQFVPEAGAGSMAPAVAIDLNRPMGEILAELSRHPVKTRLSLTGPLIVARDVAHARIQAMLEAGEPMPEWFVNHPIYYAGPAKTPEGMASGSFGPTTAGRMDSYVDGFMARGGSRVMLAKGNRSAAVRDACRKYGGFYLGSVGGPAAVLAKENIVKVETVAFPELGMEAVRRIEVRDFPAFIVTDDKGNDFYGNITGNE
jgi:fumarate hydratase class I